MSTPATSDYHHSHHQGSHSHHTATATHGQPSRSHSTRSRPNTSANAAGTPHRSVSHSAHHGHSRQSSTSSRPVQDILPQRDYEASNLASKRSSSRDRHVPPTSRGVAAAAAVAADPKGLHRRTSNRAAAGHPPGDRADPTVVANANNPGPEAVPPVMQAAADARATGAKTRTTRTSIPTQSGKWILGKTIGAGSMGKVKLAKKEDGTEQVSQLIPKVSHLPLSVCPLTKLFAFLGGLQDYTSRLHRGKSSQPCRQGTSRSVQRDPYSSRGCNCHSSRSSQRMWAS
jgi:serine/threonine protein kinase KIN1/2